jgi:hypothetical protein
MSHTPHQIKLDKLFDKMRQHPRKKAEGAPPREEEDPLETMLREAKERNETDAEEPKLAVERAMCLTFQDGRSTQADTSVVSFVSELGWGRQEEKEKGKDKERSSSRLRQKLFKKSPLPRGKLERNQQTLDRYFPKVSISHVRVPSKEKPPREVQTSLKPFFKKQRAKQEQKKKEEEGQAEK